MTTWTALCPLSELAPGDRRVLRVPGARLAVFRLDDGEVFAIDDVCPHEGYPLSEGVVRGDTVTCSWHAFRFALRDGRCLVGDEAVRAFPVRVEAGVIEADLTPPDPVAARRARTLSLEEAVLERRLGQITRDVLRLVHLGMPTAEILHIAVRIDAERGLYGMTHVFPLAADLLANWDAIDDDGDRLLALTAPFVLAAEGHTRRPLRATPDPVDPGADPDVALARLRVHVEAEEAAPAEALLRGLLARGWGRAELERGLLRICADHFLDLGHHVIYLAKLFDYADAAGPGALAEVLPAWLISVVTGTRHDVLPRWRWLATRLADLGAGLDAAIVGADAPRDLARRTHLIGALSGYDRDAAFDLVATSLADGALEDVLDALSIAAAERISSFDAAIERDPELQDGWLDVTHAFTYVHALRLVAPRFREPGLVRLIFFAVRYVQSLTSLDADNPMWLASDSPPSLSEALSDALSRDGVRPIILAHLVKVAVAAFEEDALIEDRRALDAMSRFHNASFVVNPMPQLVHEARRLLEDGKVPKTRW